MPSNELNDQASAPFLAGKSDTITVQGTHLTRRKFDCLDPSVRDHQLLPRCAFDLGFDLK